MYTYTSASTRATFLTNTRCSYSHSNAHILANTRYKHTLLILTQQQQFDVHVYTYIQVHVHCVNTHLFITGQGREWSCAAFV